MVSQLLFGEPVSVLASSPTGEWSQVQNQADQYMGWARSKSLSDSLAPSPDYFTYYFQPIFGNITIETNSGNQTMPMVRGAKIHLPKAEITEFPKIAKFIDSEGVSYIFSSKSFAPPLPYSPDLLCRLASEYLNAPYLWGGKSVLGIDCSGLIQVVFSLMGIELPRDAWQQAAVMEPIPLSKRKRGDIAFFGSAPDKITHVGILLSPTQILHSAGRVRIDVLTEDGIYDSRGEKTHSLHSIRRLPASIVISKI
jgi:hypothetical protein